ncbi:MAG: tRNA (adenosine(37)-N6)-threonylcarbamoyltransferase complex dimerization subunit type 1 TsaB [Propionibacteriales bacterium]|nr:tRNA (adenosine(37)-N6)-threonylcarbamoyltransferase complex dimerization subunit type 1 TsaB [Propionibacteriales bacterium]
MSLILGIDTATDVRAGVARDGRPVASAAVENRRAHAEQLLPLVQQVVAEAGVRLSELTGVVVGVGPGPFTGLRVGVAAAEVLAEALGVPVRGVCSLDVIAREWADEGSAPVEFVVVADARRKEVYWARYSGDGQRVDGPFVTAADAVPVLPLAGPGATLTGRSCDGPDALDAAVMAAASERLTEEGLEPLYLRRPDAEVPTTRKSTITTARIGMMGPR